MNHTETEVIAPKGYFRIRGCTKVPSPDPFRPDTLTLSLEYTVDTAYRYDITVPREDVTIEWVTSTFLDINRNHPEALQRLSEAEQFGRELFYGAA